MEEYLKNLRQIQEERQQTLIDWLAIYKDWQAPDNMPIEAIEKWQNRYTMQTEWMQKTYPEYVDDHGNVLIRTMQTKEDTLFMEKTENERADLLSQVAIKNKECIAALDDYRKSLTGEHMTFKEDLRKTKGYVEEDLADAQFVDKKI